MTVGNEEYGSWETDNHTIKNDPTTYAAAVAGSSGYYALIKKANFSTLVGVDVDPDYAPWDQDVMSSAPYDFVEYHYYPETPGSESDSFLVNSAAQDLTANISTIRTELAKWGTPNTPIYVGEIGGAYSNPGKQSWSITQGLYAGQVLGEMMNDGVSRLTWWIGFGNCNGSAGNDSSSLYGWQDFGAYNVFSDGPSDTTCPGAGPIGTMSPTARAFQLFSNVAVNNESVLTTSVTGDTADVVAYAATHSGGTALVLFNRNETTAESVEVTLSGQSSSSGVTVITYDKAIYDQTNSATPVWAAPSTTNLGAQSLPLTLTLTPWSMNVILIR
jgi:alpha-L-arabinofuranosidase